jgi:hypothetical protein
MKTLLLTALLLSISAAHATVLGITTVWLPLYLHGSDSDVELRIVQVPFVSANSSPEAEYSAISRPFVPPSDDSWKQKGDVNLASLYGIAVSIDCASQQEWVVTVDASQAKAPEKYPFSIGQVTDAVVTCVTMLKPIKPASEQKLTIKVIKPS